jgi:predicted DNA-binding transcriptional regulator YafY
MLRDDSSLRRQLVMLRALTSRHYGLTVREMAQDAGVNEKTIRRDLERFRSVGFPLEEVAGEFGRKTWKIRSEGSHPSLSFSFDEAIALYLGRRLLQPLAGTVFCEAAQKAFQKIRTALGPKALDYLDQFSGLFHQTMIGVSAYESKAELIDNLMTATEDSKAIHILYQSERATEPAFRDVYPFGLIWHKAWLYLIAFDPQEDKLETYKVDRIEEVEVSQFPFRRPEGFSLSAHLASTFGIYQGNGEPTTIKVRFAPTVARYVLETKWPGCWQMEKQRDGSVLAEFRLSDTKEFRSWLFSFGAKAVVLEPEELRREIVEEVEKLLAAYSSLNKKTGQQVTQETDDPTVTGLFSPRKPRGR